MHQRSAPSHGLYVGSASFRRRKAPFNQRSLFRSVHSGRRAVAGDLSLLLHHLGAVRVSTRFLHAALSFFNSLGV